MTLAFAKWLLASNVQGFHIYIYNADAAFKPIEPPIRYIYAPGVPAVQPAFTFYTITFPVMSLFAGLRYAIAAHIEPPQIGWTIKWNLVLDSAGPCNNPSRDYRRVWSGVAWSAWAGSRFTSGKWYYDIPERL
jgi:hypothetical protein